MAGFNHIKLSQKKILYVIGSLSVGGAERHVVSVSKALVERGCRVGIYCLLERGALEQTAREAGVEVVGPPIVFEPRFFRKPIRLALLCLSFLKLFSLFLFRRPSIVHFFLPIAYILGAVAGRLAFLPHMVMSRRSMNVYQEKYKLLSRVEHAQHGAMTAILGNSLRVVEDLKREGVRRDQLCLIYNGIDLQPFKRFSDPDRVALRDELGLSSSTLVITIVANLIPYKGHVDLLQGLGTIADRMPKDWRLLIVGRDDGIGAALQEQAQNLEIADHIAFLGSRSDVAAILLASDVGVLCSHEEGFSNALLEGMAAGLPMVATDVGGNAEAVVDGVTGLIVPAKDPHRLGSAVLTLALDRETAQAMGVAGRKQVEEHFSLDTCVDRYEAFYQGLAEGRKTSEMPGIRISDFTDGRQV